LAIAIASLASDLSHGATDESHIARELTPEQVGAIDRLVMDRMELLHIPGLAVGIYDRGKILLAKGYGLANVELKVPVKAETLFQSGSVGKQFVSAAVMMLVEEGRVGLDDSIVKYFPNAPQSWMQIHLKNLLSHTSGLAEYESGERIGPKGPFYLRLDFTEDELVEKIEALPIEFKPAEGWAYRNTNYVLLGVIIHKVTGKFYADYLQERIFKPLGMNSTRLISDSDIIPNRASGYEKKGNTIKNQEWVSPTFNSTADGTLYFNVIDLAKWDAALYGTALLKQSSLDRIWNVFPLNNGKPNPANYGFAWSIGLQNGRKVIEHGGAWQGFTCYIARYVDDSLTVTVLTNYNAGMPGMFAHQIAGLVSPALAPAGAAPAASVKVPLGQLQKYAGVYRMAPSWKLEFALEDGQFILKRQKGSSIPLQAVSTTAFLALDSEVLFTFLPAEEGGAQRVLRHPPNAAEGYGVRVDEPLDDPEKPAVTVAPKILEKYVGDYQLAPIFFLTVRHVGTSLTAQATGQGVTDLVAESDVRFNVRQVTAAFEFKSDPDGQVTGLVLFQNGAEMPAKRIKANEANLTAEPETPKPAPAWSLKDLEGNLVSSDQFKGKIVVLDFWASWCAGCVSEMPGYVALQEKYGTDGVVVVGISMDQKVSDAKEFIEKHGITYKIVMADKDVANVFGVEALPGTFIINRDGMMVDHRTGVVVETSEFEKALLKVLKPASPSL